MKEHGCEQARGALILTHFSPSERVNWSRGAVIDENGTWFGKGCVPSDGDQHVHRNVYRNNICNGFKFTLHRAKNSFACLLWKDTELEEDNTDNERNIQIIWRWTKIKLIIYDNVWALLMRF